jgi:hypothetical protein
MQQEVGALLSELDPSIFVLDCEYNMDQYVVIPLSFRRDASFTLRASLQFIQRRVTEPIVQKRSFFYPRAFRSFSGV